MEELHSDRLDVNRSNDNKLNTNKFNNEYLTSDEQYMKKAIELAKKGVGKVNPNPLVGAVVVKNGEVIGTGFHEEYGKEHAEVNAIYSCPQDVRGSTIYVTLEPCCHYGKTPPCTDIIIKSGIKRVVVGCVDNNPVVSGNGIKELEKNNIEVKVGVCKEECIELNEIFFYSNANKKPFVVMKYAMTLDGKIATRSGDSKWITGEISRKDVHKTRNKLSAIMIGIGTVLKDDPILTCRVEDGRNPIRIICDSNLRIPLDSKISKTAEDVKTIIATISDNGDKIKKLEQKGLKIIRVKEKDERLDLNDLMKKLWEEKIDSILLEGGSELNFSSLENGIVNRVQVYIAPKIFGGIESVSAISGIGVDKVRDSFNLKFRKIKSFDEDVFVEYDVIY